MAEDTNKHPEWGEVLVSSFRTQTATWLITFLVGVLTVFSAQITESIKFALNRADLRTEQFKNIAAESSQYIFSAELITEFIENGWTTKKSLTMLVEDYNTSINTLRRNEFVYRSWIHKFWRDNELSKFDKFMESVGKFDKAIHDLNDEFEKVNSTGEQKKIDKQRAKQAVPILQKAVKDLREKGRYLLFSLE